MFEIIRRRYFCFDPFPECVQLKVKRAHFRREKYHSVYSLPLPNRKVLKPDRLFPDVYIRRVNFVLTIYAFYSNTTYGQFAFNAREINIYN